MRLRCEVRYSDKRSSSGRIVNGRIALHIGSRLPLQVQRLHIEQLTEKLSERVERLLKVILPSDGPIVSDSAELERLADSINDKHFRLSFSGVSFKGQAARWGSCSLKTRRIYLSDRLKGAPLELVEYVLVHEFAHLLRPDHSPEFWSHVKRVCPDYANRRKQLEAWDLVRCLSL